MLALGSKKCIDGHIWANIFNQIFLEAPKSVVQFFPLNDHLSKFLVGALNRWGDSPTVAQTGEYPTTLARQ
jgi:hypothetical protein